MDFDDSKLRDDLIDYFGTAMASGYPMAVMEVSQAEHASSEELIEMAQNNGFDLNKYLRNH